MLKRTPLNNPNELAPDANEVLEVKAEEPQAAPQAAPQEAAVEAEVAPAAAEAPTSADLKKDADKKVKAFQALQSEVNAHKAQLALADKAHKEAFQNFEKLQTFLHSVKDTPVGGLLGYTDKTKAEAIVDAKQNLLKAANKHLTLVREFQVLVIEHPELLTKFIAAATEAATAQALAYPQWSMLWSKVTHPDAIKSEAAKAIADFKLYDTKKESKGEIVTEAENVIKKATHLVKICQLNEVNLDPEKSMEVFKMISQLTIDQQADFKVLAASITSKSQLEILEAKIMVQIQENAEGGVERKIKEVYNPQTKIFNALQQLNPKIREDMLHKALGSSNNPRELVANVNGYLEPEQIAAIALLPEPASGSEADAVLLQNIAKALVSADEKGRARCEVAVQSEKLELEAANAPSALAAYALSATSTLAELANNSARMLQTAGSMVASDSRVQKAVVGAGLSLVASGASALVPQAGTAIQTALPAMKSAVGAIVDGKNPFAAAILEGDVDAVSGMLAGVISRDANAQAQIKQSFVALITQFRTNLESGSNDSASAATVQNARELAVQTLKAGFNPNFPTHFVTMSH